MMEHLEIEKLRSVTREEMQDNVDAVLEMVNDGNGPILIRSEGYPDLLLIGWEDYWERFGMLHKPGEREDIEEACRNYTE